MSSAGMWTIEVSAPHPCWSIIKFGDQEIRGIHHEHLRDLEYVVQRAIIDAKNKLGCNYKHEVD